MGNGFGSDTIAGLAGRIAGLAPAPVRFGWGTGRFNGQGHLVLDADGMRLSGQVDGSGAIDFAASRAQVSGWQRLGPCRVGLRLRADQGNRQTPLRVLAFEQPADAERLIAWLPPAASRSSLVRRWYEERLGPYRREAWATYALCALLLACFAMQALQAGSVAFDATTLLAQGANYPPRTLAGEGWRLLTAVFLHADFGHLLGNVITFLALGPYVERLYGRAAVPALFAGAGLTGSALDLYVNFGIVAVGASGAVFGIVGALLAYPLRRPGHLPLGSMRAILAFGGLYTAWSLQQGFGQAGVNNSAHLAGLAAGFALGTLLAPPFEREARAAWWPVAAAGTLLVVLAGCAAALAFARGSGDFRLATTLVQLDARAAALDRACRDTEAAARRDPAAGLAAFEGACVRTLDEIATGLRSHRVRDPGLRARIAEQLAMIDRHRAAHASLAAGFADLARLQPAEAARIEALDACRAASDKRDADGNTRALRSQCLTGLDRALELLDAARPARPEALRRAHASRVLWRAERRAFARIAHAVERSDSGALRRAVAEIEAARTAFGAATGTPSGGAGT